LNNNKNNKINYNKIARTLEYHKGWRTEAGRSIHNRRRNGNSSTKESDLQITTKKIESTYQVTQIEFDKRP